MHIYHKYLYKAVFLQFIAVLATLTGIVWITQSMRIVDLIVNKGINFLDFLKITMLLVPYLVFIIIPVALFFSGISVAYKFLLDKEMIILKSIGLSDFQIAKPFLNLAILIVGLSYIISCYVLPLSYGKFKDLQVYFRNNYASILLEEGVFSSQVNKLTLYVDKKIDEKTYGGIVVYDNREVNNPKVVFAKEGKIFKTQNNSWFELYNGSHQEKNISGDGLSVLYFDKYSINFSLFEEDYIRTIEPNEKYITELFDISPDEESKRNKLISHGHFRLSWPLNSLALMMLATSMLITNSYQRKEGVYRNLVVGILGIGFIILSILFNNFTLHNLNFAVLMYLAPIVLMIFALIRFKGANNL
ncbi:LptF/LptG family permease [Candidatus Jidaibacter acanthamoebae]|nr:LptF/LptG family permease [Candidatus Jidaibacter acanthamoeba]